MPSLSKASLSMSKRLLKRSSGTLIQNRFLRCSSKERESRRILGVHTVTAEEYVSGERYPDSISRGAHQIDMHSGKGTGQVLIKLKQAAWVPYRALIAKGFPNLLVAGRCISADRKALASLRVQASCMGLGQAAGVAAARSLRAGCAVQDINTDALIETLRSMGALI